MRRTLTIAAVLIVLTGCTTAQAHKPTPALEPAPTVTCLSVSPQAQEALQRHLDAVATPQNILTITSVLSPNATPTDPAWFVAAEVNSQGDHVTAVWFTVNDPTAPGDNAFMSIDAMAATISDYLRPEGASAAMEGAQQARACLK